MNVQLLQITLAFKIAILFLSNLLIKYFEITRFKVVAEDTEISIGCILMGPHALNKNSFKDVTVANVSQLEANPIESFDEELLGNIISLKAPESESFSVICGTLSYFCSLKRSSE